IGGLNTESKVDIIEPLVSFIVSRFTSNYSIYFAVWAGIFGFFYLKSVNLLYFHNQENHGWNTTILMVFFIMIIPVTSISGIRMWTAAWIFFFGAYHVIVHRDPRYFLIAILSCLLHWSYLSVNILLLIYYLAGNRNLIYLPLALASFVVPQLITPFLRAISLRMGGAYQKRFEGYSSEEYLLVQQESAQQSAWFLKIGSNILFYYLLLMIIFIQFQGKSVIKEKDEKNLYSFLLLLLAFVNFGMPIPSLGTRFQVIFFLFATLYIYFYFSKLPGNRISFPIVLGLFPMLLYTAINFRMGSESISAWILSPGFGIPLLSPVLSLSEMLFN
ncbi:MAG: EpsG family protein, partial [Bacteroidales bacterium]